MYIWSDSWPWLKLNCLLFPPGLSWSVQQQSCSVRSQRKGTHKTQIPEYYSKWQHLYSYSYFSHFFPFTSYKKYLRAATGRSFLPRMGSQGAGGPGQVPLLQVWGRECESLSCAARELHLQGALAMLFPPPQQGTVWAKILLWRIQPPQRHFWCQ